MTYMAMNALKEEYGSLLRIEKAVHLHDEDEWNRFVISYNGIICGSELSSINSVRAYIKNTLQKGE